ncbi:SDR family NAD(P)-dependent oxidoreductase [Ferrovibrio sp.]|uniref:SDR family NAD(P)-dependent oxidoreductase n=1 Tax=Ferrovibrio sp. TaxID=1917215 RepID=UPI0035B03C2A
MKIETGQVAVITGGASGIGFALAKALLARGVQIALVDIEAPALTEAAAELSAQQPGGNVAAFTADVSDAATMTALANEVASRFGGVDLLVNNAGVGGLLGPIWDSHPNDWPWVFGVNVFGVVNGLRAFLPGMLARERAGQHAPGHVLNVASLAGLTAPPFLTAYTASKHAVVGLSESLAQELAIVQSRIRVSTVCPGVVRSRIKESGRNRPPALAGASRTPPEMLARIEAAFAAQMQNPMEGDAFAARVLAGIEANEPLILTHPAENAHALARLEGVRAAVARQAGEQQAA